jgi:hypothetical protein
MKMLQKIYLLLSIVATFVVPVLIIVFCFGEKKTGWLYGDGSDIILCLLFVFPIAGLFMGLFTMFDKKIYLIGELLMFLLCIIAIASNRYFGAWVIPSFIVEWLVGACFPFVRWLNKKEKKK